METKVIRIINSSCAALGHLPSLLVSVLVSAHCCGNTFYEWLSKRKRQNIRSQRGIQAKHEKSDLSATREDDLPRTPPSQPAAMPYAQTTTRGSEKRFQQRVAWHCRGRVGCERIVASKFWAQRCRCPRRSHCIRRLRQRREIRRPQRRRVADFDTVRLLWSAPLPSRR